MNIQYDKVKEVDLEAFLSEMKLNVLVTEHVRGEYKTVSLPEVMYALHPNGDGWTPLYREIDFNDSIDAITHTVAQMLSGQLLCVRGGKKIDHRRIRVVYTAMHVHIGEKQ